MALRKKKTEQAVATQTVSDWSVADLSALYAEYRSSLIGQARRILRSDADAALWTRQNWGIYQFRPSP